MLREGRRQRGAMHAVERKRQRLQHLAGCGFCTNATSVADFPVSAGSASVKSAAASPPAFSAKPPCNARTTWSCESRAPAFSRRLHLGHVSAVGQGDVKRRSPAIADGRHVRDRLHRERIAHVVRLERDRCARRPRGRAERDGRTSSAAPIRGNPCPGQAPAVCRRTAGYSRARPHAGARSMPEPRSGPSSRAGPSSRHERRARRRQRRSRQPGKPMRASDRPAGSCRSLPTCIARPAPPSAGRSWRRTRRPAPATRPPGTRQRPRGRTTAARRRPASRTGSRFCSDRRNSDRESVRHRATLPPPHPRCCASIVASCRSGRFGPTRHRLHRTITAKEPAWASWDSSGP